MAFEIRFTDAARATYAELESKAKQSLVGRGERGKTKSSKQEGLFKQIAKTLRHLADNPRHPGLQTHEYSGLQHPYHPNSKVWEAYAQQKTPSAYRVFWCYGPQQGQITIIAITPHS